MRQIFDEMGREDSKILDCLNFIAWIMSAAISIAVGVLETSTYDSHSR